MSDDGLDDSKMPLLDHLIELRTRLMYSILAVFAAFLVCYYFSADIYAFLVRPLANLLGNEGRRMIYTGLTEAFFTYVKVAFWAGTFLSFPIIATQLWMFVAPGLYKHETQRLPAVPGRDADPVLPGRRAGLLRDLPAGVAVFPQLRAVGARSGGIADPVRSPRRRISVAGDDADLRLRHRLPVAGPADAADPRRAISSDALAAKRKYALVAILIVAAVLTPPDVISQIGLAIPLYMLYEISVQVGRLIEKQRAKREAEQEAADRAESKRSQGAAE